MPQVVSPQLPYQNRVLTSLSPPDLKRLAPHLVPLTLKIRHSLLEPGELIDTVYFMEDAVASVVVAMETGDTVEVGLIGREGVVGLPAVMGSDRGVNRTYIQLAGRGYSLKANILREQFESSSGLRSCVYRAIQGYMVQTAQTAACNRVHELEPRLARWLIMCSDRVQSDHINITHEFLAMMLGTQRSSVTIAAGILHKAGLIIYSRGSVSIQDRKGLIDAACECYQTVQAEYLRLGLL